MGEYDNEVDLIYLDFVKGVQRGSYCEADGEMQGCRVKWETAGMDTQMVKR